MEERALLSTFVVNTVSDLDTAGGLPAGQESLRQAIEDVNADTGAGTDAIDFNIPGSGVQTIQPLRQLPTITHPVVIDGYSQPGSSPNNLAADDNASLLIQLDGSQAGYSFGLGISAGNSEVMGLVVSNFESYGIFLRGTGGNVIEGNFLGTDPTGQFAEGNSQGVSIQCDGNRIGTDGSGSTDIPEGTSDYADRNLVSGNDGTGIAYGILVGGDHNVVAGNFVGTDVTGTKPLGNVQDGVFVVGYCNRIGADGYDADPSAERNIISGNAVVGVSLQGSGQNIVAGNFIGTDVTGTQPLGNGFIGVDLYGSNANFIGTDGDGVGDAAERNLISANRGDGLDISTGSDNNVVAGNYIGTDVTGTRPLGNSRAGINVNYGSSFNRIGTDGQSVDNVGEANVISCNGGGMNLGSGAPGQGNLIAGNFIGTDVDGNPITGFVQPKGIEVAGDSNDQIGGSPTLANTIANDRQGVAVSGASTGVSIRANHILINAPGLGIDLGEDGVTLNNSHAGQPGPNNWQNFPVLSTTVTGPATRVLGTLNSTASTTFTLDFYANDPDKGNGGAHGPGQYYLGSATVTTDSSGNVSFNVPGLAATTPGEWISATATDPGGNTSEFALDVPAIQVATVTVITPSAATPLAGVDTVSFTAGVAGAIPGTGTPSGSVHFFDTTTNTDLGSANLSSGVAVLPPSFLATGSHTIVATYSGDASFLPSAATTTVNVIPPASLSGMVFSDFNNDGQVDFGEQGISGVPITVTGTDDLGNPVNLSQMTDADGTYVFLGLRPGIYSITETQPAGYTQGINTIGTGGGFVWGDQFTGINLAAGEDAMNYNYGEQPAATGPIQQGQTAGIGFWNNKNGQALINALNGGTGTQLGDWLAATFPHMFGSHSGSNDLAGESNAQIAAFFQSRFVVHGQKLDAQVLATALAVYVTDPTLDNTGVGTQYGFIVGGNGVATATVNVGSNGAAFGVADNTTMTVMDLLLAADAQAVDGVLYDGDTTKRNMANSVFSAINEAGDI